MADPTPSERYHYDAFISYRHVDRDRQWAKWLIEALETYRVPRTLQKKGFPPRIQRIFRDEDELPTSASLSDNIQNALKASRFLIVICSRDTPHSMWVDKEVATFRELGRDDRILALLVDGEPTESFPHSLRFIKTVRMDEDGTQHVLQEEVEPLAADVRPRHNEPLKQLKRMAVLRIMASLLGCAFDELRQRDAERERRKRRIRYSAVSLILLFICAAALAWWDYNRVKVAYYKNWIERWGIYEGIGRISQTEMEHLQRHCRVETRRGAVIRIANQNSYGQLIDAGDGIAEWIPEYRADGKIARMVCRNHNRQVVIINDYNQDLTVVEFKNRLLQPMAKGAHDLNADNRYERRSLIIQQKVEYNAQGFPVKILYQQDPWGTPGHDAKGSYGKIYEYSPNGLAVLEYDLDASGQPRVTGNGISGQRYRWDDSINMVEQTTIDEHGNPVLPPNRNYATVKWKYDRWGNCIRSEYADDKGDLALNESGFAVAQFDFDEHGNMIRERTFGADQKPVLNDRGYSGMDYTEHDRLGNVVAFACLGTTGTLQNFTGENYCITIRQYDSRGNTLEFSTCDAQKKLVTNSSGFLRKAFTYNETGDLVQESFFAPDGRPVRCADGYAVQMVERDKLGNILKYSHFDENGKPAIDAATGAHICAKRYDKAGNPVEWAYIGKTGEPVRSKKGFARQVAEYDDAGNDIAWATYAADGRLVDINGYARVTKKYDNRGNPTEFVYTDAAGKPGIDQANGGFWKMTQATDLRGNITEQAYFLAGDKPCLNPNKGFARKTQTFSPTGNLLEDAFFGADGQPIIQASEKYAKRTMKYDSKGNMAELAYYGVDGRRLMHPDHQYARKTMDHDASGNMIAYAYHDASDHIFIHPKEGFASCHLAYDASGKNVVEFATFGVDGKPSLLPKQPYAVRLTKKYDEQGNNIELAYWGADGKPVPSDQKFSRLTMKYDQQKRVVENAHWGVDGKPFLVDGIFRYTVGYDEWGNLVDASCYGADNKLKVASQGFARIHKQFDAQKHQLEEAYYGADDKPILVGGKWPRWTKRFDAKGRKTEEAYWDVDGSLKVIDESYARREDRYDEAGHQVETCYYGKDNRLTLSKTGYARICRVYDPQGKQLEEAVFNEQNQPMNNAEGYHKWVRKYSQHGKITDESYFGPDGKLIMIKKGYARWQSEYDEHGNQTLYKTYDAQDRPVKSPQGFASWRRKYDDANNTTEASFFDENGHLVNCPDGYARCVLIYDHLKELIGADYCGPDNQPIQLPAGFARWRRESDTQTKNKIVACYDLTGKRIIPPKGVKPEEYLGDPDFFHLAKGEARKPDEATIRQALPMIQSIAASIASGGKLPPGVAFNDLISYGYEGFIKAYNSFDSSKGVKFETYAAYQVRGEILDRLRQQWKYKNPVSYKSIQAKIQEKITEVVASTPESEAITTSTVSSLSLEEKKKRAAEIIANSTIVYMLSLDNEEIINQLSKGADIKEELFNELEFAQERRILWEEVGKLNDREKDFIYLFYEKERTQKDIAEIVKVPKETIARLHITILKKLRQRLKERLSSKEYEGMVNSPTYQEIARKVNAALVIEEKRQLEPSFGWGA